MPKRKIRSNFKRGGKHRDHAAATRPKGKRGGTRK